MNSNSDQPTQRQGARALREQRVWLMGRHDTGAISPLIYLIVKSLEIDISWLERARDAS